MKFIFMKEHSSKFGIEKMAKVLGVCRSGYYEFLNWTPSKREVENQRLKEELKKIHKKSRETYWKP